MASSRSRIVAAVAGAISMSAAAAWATQPAPEIRIQELQQKVAALEQRQAANAKDLAATIDSVLRDADRRSQLLANGGDMGAGYDNGFFIRAGDNWVFRPTIQFQFRNVTDFRTDTPGSNSDEWDNGFEVRRMKFGFEGVAFTKDLTYKFEWATNRDGGGVKLEDAYATYMFADEWGIRAGQYKDPVHHEELTSSKRQLAADRSLVNELIGGGMLGWTQGVSLLYGNYSKSNPLNAEIAFTDGLDQRNTDFTDHDLGGFGAFMDEINFGVVGRVEYKFMGDWKSYRDFSAIGNKEDLLVIGAGGDWSQGGNDNLFHATADVQYETAGGLNIYGGLLYQSLDLDVLSDTMNNWGFVVQAGYMINPAWEIFGRYDITFYDDDVPTASGAEDTFNEFTVGVNYFLGTNGSAGHRAKITVDLTYLPDGVPSIPGLIGTGGGSVVDLSGLGFQGDGEDEWVLRAQFQLLL